MSNTTPTEPEFNPIAEQDHGHPASQPTIAEVLAVMEQVKKAQQDQPPNGATRPMGWKTASGYTTLAATIASMLFVGVQEARETLVPRPAQASTRCPPMSVEDSKAIAAALAPMLDARVDKALKSMRDENDETKRLQKKREEAAEDAIQKRLKGIEEAIASSTTKIIQGQAAHAWSLRQPARSSPPPPRGPP